MGAEQAEYVDCEFGLPEGSIEVGPRGEDIQLLFVHLMSEGFVEGIHLRQNFRLHLLVFEEFLVFLKSFLVLVGSQRVSVLVFGEVLDVLQVLIELSLFFFLVGY